MKATLAELAHQLRYAAAELDKAEQEAGKSLCIALELHHLEEMARIIEEHLADEAAIPETSITTFDSGLN